MQRKPCLTSCLGARESASPMIQDVQQTTMASIGQLAQSSTVCCDRLAARQLELRRRFCSHICLRQSSQPRRHASPVIAIQSKNCTASAAAALDSCTTGLYILQKSLKPCLDRSSRRARGEWRLTVSRWSPCWPCTWSQVWATAAWAYCIMQVATLPTGCKAELCHYRQRYHPPSLLLQLLLYL